jgi:hypothetical protein
MKKNILIAVLLGLIFVEGWRLHQVNSRPNNQYEVSVSPQGYILSDNKRLVAHFDWGTNQCLESAITSDNQ